MCQILNWNAPADEMDISSLREFIVQWARWGEKKLNETEKRQLLISAWVGAGEGQWDAVVTRSHW